MSKEIDERVVEMRFDNQQFENGVKTSLNTLDKLKSSLDLSGAAKGLENLDTEAKKMNFAPLSEGIEVVKSKFSALEVMGVTALANITNSAVNAGKQLLKSLTVAPIKQGYDEYELKLDSVQTIMASTGASIEEVNGYLDELNTYADKTIYSFSDMTANIGKFTNAGVDLKSAVKAIQGISNEAAVSGANANEASRAMYNFAQALSAGSVKLIDWKSIENANMATVEFKQQLIDTAVKMGTLIKVGEKYQSTTTDNNGHVSELFTSTSMFNDALSSQWMTTEVLVETLGKYADETTDIGKKAFAAAQDVKKFTQLIDTLQEAVGSGWSQTWEILFGDFEEAKTLWTELSNVIGGFIDAQSDVRNELLSGWKDLGGRTALIDAFRNAFNGVLSVVKPVSEAFREIFPATTARRLTDITENIRSFTAKLKLSDEQAEKVKETFKGLFSLLDIGLTAVKAVAGGVLSLGKNLSSIPNLVLNVSSALGRWASGMRDSAKETNVFGKAVDAIAGVIQKAIGKIKDFASEVKKKFDTIGFTDFLDVLKAIYNFTLKIGKAVVGLGASIGTALLSAFESGSIRGVIDVINTGLFGAILVSVKKFTNGLADAFGGISDILGGVSDILKGVKGSLEAWQKSLNAGTLLKIAKAIAILAVSLVVVASINDEKLTSALAGITAMFVELMAALSMLNKMNLNFTGVSKSVTMMIGMSAAILVLAGALKKMSALDWDELAVGLTGVLGLTAIIVAAAAALSKIEGKVMKGATSIVIFSSAIKILASACKNLAALSWEELVKGLTGVGVLLAEVDIFLNTAKFNGKVFSTVTGMVSLAAAIKVLASAAKDFAAMKWSEIGKGLAAIGGLLAEIAAFTKLTANAKKVTATGLAMIEIAAAMKIFASAVRDFSNMSWVELGRGLTGVAGALTAVVVAVKLMPNNVAGIGAGLVIVGAALNIIGAAISNIGKNSWNSVAKGLTSLAGSVAVLAAGLNAMKGAISGATAMTIAAAALALLTPELKILGSMSLQQIGTGLVALAGAFTVLGIAAKVLSPLAGSMIKVAAAITLFGTSCALAGAGILAVSVALTTLGASLVLTAGALGETIVDICESITNSADAIQAAFIALIKMVCNSLKETVPLIAETLLTVLVESLTSLKTYLPQIVDLLMDVLIDLFDRLSLRVPELVESFVKMLGSFMKTLDKALGKGGWEKLLLSVTAISAVFLALSAAAKLISSIPISGAVKGIAGFGIVVAGMVGVLAVLGGLAQIPGVGWLISEGAAIFSQLGLAIGSFVGNLINELITNMPSDLSKVLTAVASIEMIAVAISPLSGLLGNIDISGAAKGIAGVSILIGGIAAILAALGGLAQIPGFEWVIGEGARVLGAIGETIGNFVGSIVDGLANAVTSTLEQVISSLASVGLTIGAVAAVAKIVGKLKINPAAVAEGFAGIAVAIGCIEVILAALGGLAQIPGFEWIVGEGGRILNQLGTIIGSFVGSLISGIGVGLTSGLPEMGQNLSDFIANAAPFIEGAKNIDASVMSGVKSLAGAILCITAADLISGITSFLTGGSSIAKFGAEIAEFGPHLKSFSDSVEGINTANVTAAANAAKTLAEMADTIPNEGGIAAWFAGENSVSKFGEDIASFGVSLKEFSDNVAGVNPDNILAASSAGKALSEMAATIPNEGGVAAWFAGENSVSKFGEDIASFGKDLKDFSDNVSGINPENIVAASTAGKALAEMADTIPNEGGVTAWFAGENSVSKFGEDISGLGESLKKFSDDVTGINPENVVAAANAGKALAEMADTIPNEGGVAAWFAGENSVSKFGEDIAGFGSHLKTFADNVAGINPENVVAAANAGKALAEMAATIPNEGGIVAWFSGENSVAKFGEEIAGFGVHIKSFSDNVAGLNVEAVVAAANAGKTLAEMADTIPNEGGVAAWFAGDNSLAGFGEEIASFGKYMKSFSDNVTGLNVAAVTAASDAGKVLAGMSETIPNSGGVTAWFSGDNSLAKFGNEVASFGTSLKSFSDNVTGIDVPAVKAASEAGKTLADMANVVPNSGGVTAWFTGDNSLAKFGDEIASFGTNLKAFSNNVTGLDVLAVQAASEAGKTLVDLTNTVPNSGGISAWFSGEKSLSSFGSQIASFGKDIKAFSDNVTGLDVPAVKAASEAGKTLVEMTNVIPKYISTDNFGKAICNVGDNLVTFTNKMGYVDVTYSTGQVDKILAMIKNIQNANLESLDSLANSLKKVAEDGVNKFIKTFENAESKAKTAITNLIKKTVDAILGTKADFNNAGTTVMSKFIDGVKSKEGNAKTTFTTIISACLTVIKNKNSEFETVGHTLMVKLIAGIKSKDSDAKNAFTAIINACLTAVKNKNSEFETAGETLMTKFVNGVKSKTTSVSGSFTSGLSDAVNAIKGYYDDFYNAGKYLDKGLADGIEDYMYWVEEAARDMARAAVDAAEDELDINSPSKRFYSIGAYSGMGIVNALTDYGKNTYKAGASMAESAVDGVANAISRINDVINGSVECQPTIRPVLDLSNVETGERSLNALLSREQALSVSSAFSSRQTAAERGSESSQNSALDKGYTFIQNNYSPKALSRLEIYRQTRNQISAMKGLVNT